MANTNGHLETLVPAPVANARGSEARHLVGAPSAQDIYEAIMDAAHVAPLDPLGARPIARLEAFIEALEAEVARSGASE